MIKRSPKARDVHKKPPFRIGGRELPFIPIKEDKATFFTPSSYTASVILSGPKTLSEIKENVHSQSDFIESKLR